MRSQIPLLNDKQPKWITVLNEWRSTQESQNLPWWESQKRIHQIIKVIDRILNSVCIKKEWHKATMCQLQTTQQDNYKTVILTVDQRVARPISRVKWFTSLNLKEAYYWVQMKKGKEWKRHSEQDTDTTNTLLCCLSSRTPPPPFKG
jgi:hypothetical protein